MIDDPRLSALIGRVYETVDDPAILPDLMGDMAAFLDVELMLAIDLDLSSQGEPGLIVVERGGDFRAPHLLDYQAYQYLRDPAADHVRRSGKRGGLYDVHLHLSPEDRANHPFQRWRSDAVSVDAQSTSWALEGTDGVVALSACRATGRDPLDAAGRDVLIELFGHWRRATRLASRLPDVVLSRDPIILLDRGGRALLASPSAERLCDNGRGLKLRGGRPLADDPRDQPSLDRVMATALIPADRGGLYGAIGLRRAASPHPLLVEVEPLPARASFYASAPGALIRLIDPDAKTSGRGTVWTALFGFTPAETRLAVALMDDEANLREIADRLGIAYSTARTQAASLYEKAGVRGQVGLVRLLTRLEK